jgi:multidrug resistance efflux pump
VKAARANVQNLTVLQDFQKIVAPFPGVVTLRTVDVGDHHDGHGFHTG